MPFFCLDVSNLGARSSSFFQAFSLRLVVVGKEQDAEHWKSPVPSRLNVLAVLSVARMNVSLPFV